MNKDAQTIEITIERVIPAPPDEVFDAWLDSAVPGSPWHEHMRLLIDPKVDGLWYWLSLGNTPHYGRFVDIDRPARIEHSWMSPNTLGLESMVTVTFSQKGDDTILALRHSGLPNEAMAKGHEKGWQSILERFGNVFAAGSP
jgi:uncharacterized protein YndB with AHSA1/START domain